MMIQLRSKHSEFLEWAHHAEAQILGVTTKPGCPPPIARDRLLLLDSSDDLPEGTAGKFAAVAFRNRPPTPLGVPTVVVEPDMQYLDEGDVVRLNPRRGEIRALFRRKAPQNSLLVTERCNSFCLMCSQPPRQIDDGYLVRDIRRTIELVPRDTITLGLSGGEPTLTGDGFFEIIRHARNYLPLTELHVLTNGRRFQDASFAQRLASLKHEGVRLGIPLYSDQPDLHDFVVQAKGAYDETIKGLLNLAKHNIRIELRVVIHRYTFERLPELARFIARNLPFVEHVALMGLELTGFAKINLGNLWIDPYDYRNQLAKAVRILDQSRVPVLVFNHQLCVVSESVRPYCVASISDWKNDYLDACSDCSLKSACGGFFSSGLGLSMHSDHICPITSADAATA